MALNLLCLLLLAPSMAGRPAAAATDGSVPNSVAERYANAPVRFVPADELTDGEVFAALEKRHPVGDRVKALTEQQRRRLWIVKEKIDDCLDSPRDFPLVGPARVHHDYYKCTVFLASEISGGGLDDDSIVGEQLIGLLVVEHSCFQMVKKSARR